MVFGSIQRQIHWENHLGVLERLLNRGWLDRQCSLSLLLTMGKGFVWIQHEQLIVVIPVSCSFIFSVFSLFPALSNRIIERIFSGAVVR